MKKFFAGMGLLTVTGLLAACSGGEEMANEADAENGNGGTAIAGTLDFYTSQAEEDAQAFADAFIEQNPDVEINIVQSGTEGLLEKVQGEEAAQADVLLAADRVAMEKLKNKEKLLAYQSPEAENLDGAFVDPDGTYTGTKVAATGLIVNTEEAAELPDSWKVMTDDEAKGQTAILSPAYSDTAASNVGVITKQRDMGWEFYEELRTNAVSVFEEPEAVLESVAAGEQNYGIVADHLAAEAISEGAPVEFIYPEEGVPAVTEPVGIPSDTDNVAAAKAFVDFILSEEGQGLTAELGYTPIRQGIEAPDGLQTVEEIAVMEADMAGLIRARDFDLAKFRSMFTYD